jgi:hypothetical protein
MGYQYQVRNQDEVGCDWPKQWPNKFYKDNTRRLIPQRDAGLEMVSKEPANTQEREGKAFTKTLHIACKLIFGQFRSSMSLNEQQMVKTDQYCPPLVSPSLCWGVMLYITGLLTTFVS